jgi:hypothetical protein
VLRRQRRELKHRAEGETRTGPVHPELVALLRNHLKEYGTVRATASMVDFAELPKTIL